MSLQAQLASLRENVDRSVYGKASILFDKHEAAKYDVRTIFDLSTEGFHELCRLEPRLRTFGPTLFHESSLTYERGLKTKEENKALDASLRSFLRLLTPYFLMRSTHRVLEYLIRRYEIHLHNVEDILAAFLPFHESVMFGRLVQVLEIQGRWEFLAPAKKHRTPIPRAILAAQCLKDQSVLQFCCQAVEDAVLENVAPPVLLTFFTVLVLETLTMASQTSLSSAKQMFAKSNKGLSRAVLNAALPFIMRGLKAKSHPTYQTACYLLLTRLGGLSGLAAQMFQTIVNGICGSVTSETVERAYIALACIFESQGAYHNWDSSSNTSKCLKSDGSQALILEAGPCKRLLKAGDPIQAVENAEEQVNCTVFKVNLLLSTLAAGIEAPRAPVARKALAMLTRLRVSTLSPVVYYLLTTYLAQSDKQEVVELLANAVYRVGQTYGKTLDSVLSSVIHDLSSNADNDVQKLMDWLAKVLSGTRHEMLSDDAPATVGRAQNAESLSISLSLGHSSVLVRRQGMQGLKKLCTSLVEQGFGIGYRQNEDSSGAKGKKSKTSSKKKQTRAIEQAEEDSDESGFSDSSSDEEFETTEEVGDMDTDMEESKESNTPEEKLLSFVRRSISIALRDDDAEMVTLALDCRQMFYPVGIPHRDGGELDTTGFRSEAEGIFSSVESVINKWRTEAFSKGSGSVEANLICSALSSLGRGYWSRFIEGQEVSMYDLQQRVLLTLLSCCPVGLEKAVPGCIQHAACKELSELPVSWCGNLPQAKDACTGAAVCNTLCTAMVTEVEGQASSLTYDLCLRGTRVALLSVSTQPKATQRLLAVLVSALDAFSSALLNNTPAKKSTPKRRRSRSRSRSRSASVTAEPVSAAQCVRTISTVLQATVEAFSHSADRSLKAISASLSGNDKGLAPFPSNISSSVETPRHGDDKSASPSINEATACIYQVAASALLRLQQVAVRFELDRQEVLHPWMLWLLSLPPPCFPLFTSHIAHACSEIINESAVETLCFVAIGSLDGRPVSDVARVRALVLLSGALTCINSKTLGSAAGVIPFMLLCCLDKQPALRLQALCVIEMLNEAVNQGSVGRWQSVAAAPGSTLYDTVAQPVASSSTVASWFSSESVVASAKRLLTPRVSSEASEIAISPATCKWVCPHLLRFKAEIRDDNDGAIVRQLFSKLGDLQNRKTLEDQGPYFQELISASLAMPWEKFPQYLRLWEGLPSSALLPVLREVACFTVTDKPSESADSSLIGDIIRYMLRITDESETTHADFVEVLALFLALASGAGGAVAAAEALEALHMPLTLVASDSIAKDENSNWIGRLFSTADSLRNTQRENSWWKTGTLRPAQTSTFTDSVRAAVAAVTSSGSAMSEALVCHADDESPMDALLRLGIAGAASPQTKVAVASQKLLETCPITSDVLVRQLTRVRETTPQGILSVQEHTRSLRGSSIESPESTAWLRNLSTLAEALFARIDTMQIGNQMSLNAKDDAAWLKGLKSKRGVLKRGLVELKPSTATDCLELLFSLAENVANILDRMEAQAAEEKDTPMDVSAEARSGDMDPEYALQMLFSVLHAMVWAVIRGNLAAESYQKTFKVDLVVRCAQVTSMARESSRTAALLLLSAMAAGHPATVLHHVMPVFTGTGTKILMRDDGYTFSVLQKIIHAVVPALRTHGPAIGLSPYSLLKLFTASLPQLPLHRRVGTLRALVLAMATARAEHSEVTESRRQRKKHSKSVPQPLLEEPSLKEALQGAKVTLKAASAAASNPGRFLFSIVGLLLSRHVHKQLVATTLPVLTQSSKFGSAADLGIALARGYANRVSNAFTEEAPVGNQGSLTQGWGSLTSLGLDPSRLTTSEEWDVGDVDDEEFEGMESGPGFKEIPEAARAVVLRFSALHQIRALQGASQLAWKLMLSAVPSTSSQEGRLAPRAEDLVLEEDVNRLLPVMRESVVPIRALLNEVRTDMEEVETKLNTDSVADECISLHHSTQLYVSLSLLRMVAAHSVNPEFVKQLVSLQESSKGQDALQAEYLALAQQLFLVLKTASEEQTAAIDQRRSCSEALSKAHAAFASGKNAKNRAALIAAEDENIRVLAQLEILSHIIDAVYNALRKLSLHLSVSSFVAVVTELLYHEDPQIRRRSLHFLSSYVAERSANDPFTDAETLLFLDMMPELCRVVGDEDELPVNRQTAVLSIDVLARCFGVDAPLAFVDSVPVVIACLNKPLTEAKDLASLQLIGSAFLCLATLASRLKARLLPFLPKFFPRLLDGLEWSTAAMKASATASGEEEEAGEERESVKLLLESALASLLLIAEHLPNFLSPFLERIVTALAEPTLLPPAFASTTKKEQDLEEEKDEGSPYSEKVVAIFEVLSNNIPARILLEPLAASIQHVAHRGPLALFAILTVLKSIAQTATPEEIESYHRKLFSLVLRCSDYRWAHITPLFVGDRSEYAKPSVEEVSLVEHSTGEVFLALMLRLSEKQLRPLLLAMLQWANTSVREIPQRIASISGRKESLPLAFISLCRRLTTYRCMEMASIKFKSIFTPFFGAMFRELCVETLMLSSTAGEEADDASSDAASDSEASASDSDSSSRKRRHGGAASSNKRQRIGDGATSSLEIANMSLADLEAAWAALPGDAYHASLTTSIAVPHKDAVTAAADLALPSTPHSLRCIALRCLRQAFLHDKSNFATKARTQSAMDALLSQFALPFKSHPAALTDNGVVPVPGAGAAFFDYISTYAAPVFVALVKALQKDILWKPINKKLLFLLRSKRASTRLAVLRTLHKVYTDVGEEYIIMLPETIPFLAEVMSDPDEDVEKECHALLRFLSKLSGEDIHDYLK